MTGRSGDAQAIVDVALSAAEPRELDPTKRYAITAPDDGTVHIIKRAEDDQLDVPRRIRGESTVYDVDSFKYLWDKFSRAESELFADPKAHRITGVFNADDTALTAGFRDHRAVLACELTASWRSWTSINGQLLPQTTFAEFLEDHLSDVVAPAGAEMLEIAQSFQAATNVDFKSAQILSSGQRQFRFEETTAAKAGQTGELEVPAVIELGLQPFEGGDAYRVMARFRYRISSGNLTIGVRLERPDEVLRSAFLDTSVRVREACGDRQVLTGAPPPPR